MKLKIFGYMTVFIAIVIALLWLFQIVLLDDVYRGTVTLESKALVKAISVACDLDEGEGLQTRVYSLAAAHWHPDFPDWVYTSQFSLTGTGDSQRTLP